MQISIVTLRLLKYRIESLVNKGKEVCAEFETDRISSYNSISCNKCGYTADLHLLKAIYDDLNSVH